MQLEQQTIHLVLLRFSMSSHRRQLQAATPVPLVYPTSGKMLRVGRNTPVSSRREEVLMQGLYELAANAAGIVTHREPDLTDMRGSRPYPESCASSQASSACRCVSVLSNTCLRCDRAVLGAMPSVRAAAPSPLPRAAWIATAASVAVRP